MALSALFSKLLRLPAEPYTGYGQDYMTSNLDILLQQGRRNKAIRENRIFDFIQVENDPNFSRNSEINSKTLDKFVSDLSLATQIVTTVNAKLYMAGIHEFLPSNIGQMLLNFQSIADTNISALPDIKKLITVKQIEQAFLEDLTIQFAGQTLSYKDISFMGNTIIENMPLFGDVPNDGIRPLLSLTAGTLLQGDLLDVFNSLQYLDAVDSIFGDGSPELALFEELFHDRLTEYSATPVAEIITTPDDYTSAFITMTDPLGLNLQAQFSTEIETHFVEEITAIVDDLTSAITEEQREELLTIFVEDAEANVENTFSGQVGLPNLLQVVNGVNAASHNLTVNAITDAFDSFSKNLINEIGLNQATDSTRPADYLINLKRNLKKRLDMKKRGDTSVAFAEIDAYLKSVIKDQNLSDANLEGLNEFIENLLKEKIDVC